LVDNLTYFWYNNGMTHPFYDMLPMVIGKIQKDFHHRMSDKMREYNITTAQLIYLIILSEKERTTLKELTAESNFDKAYTTKIVRELTAKGFLQNDKKSPSSRKYHLFLTDEGKNYIKIVQQNAKAIREEILSELTKSEKDTIVETLRQAITYLED